MIPIAPTTYPPRNFRDNLADVLWPVALGFVLGGIVASWALDMLSFVG